MSISANAVTLSRGEQTIVDNISLDIPSGQVLAIVGPNGAGKSTLLSLLAGDVYPTSGSISYDGVNIDDLDIHKRALTRSVMAQSQIIAFNFSVFEIIHMGWLSDARGYNENRVPRIIEDIARQCEIYDLLNRSYNSLSGGEKQRVHFARALLQLWLPDNINENRYLLLDEPLASLDISHEIKILKAIKHKAESGIGVLVVMHDLNLAAKFSDKIIVLSNGKLIKYGTPKEVFTQALLSEVYSIPIIVNQNPLTITYY